MQKNISNKSYNSKNVSKHKIKNKNKPKNDYKYKTISNIFSGNNTKKIKDNNSIKIINNYIKPYVFYNYNSINSIRSKRLDKSDSRSLISRKVITKSKVKPPDESISSKIFINNNKSDNISNKDKKENENYLMNNNKIMINYNTNIINTNVSFDKITLRQKMEEIRKSIEEKISEITRNKKYNIRRTISAIYGKKNKSPFYNEKIKTKRESLLRYNERKINRNKLDIKLKFKNKNSSMLNIKNEINKNKDKMFLIQSHTGKKPGGNIQLYKYKDKDIKSKKYSSIINLNNKIQISKKNLNLENSSRTIINNLHKSRLSYRKNSNFGKINAFKDRINKNDIKIKNINNRNNNKSTSSLRKYIFNKYISNSKAG